MTIKTKQIFLFLTIMVPFIFYCIYYYGHMLRDAPFKFAEFKSITIAFGTKDSLINKFDSETGDYQYLNKRDSLVKVNIHLTKEDLLFLHRKAADLGFWDFPKDETNGDTTRFYGRKTLRYVIEFNYKRKSKKVTFDANYTGDGRLKDANVQLIKFIEHTLADAEYRDKK